MCCMGSPVHAGGGRAMNGAGVQNKQHPKRGWGGGGISPSAQTETLYVYPVAEKEEEERKRQAMRRSHR